jgi:uncharacterized membrane protein
VQAAQTDAGQREAANREAATAIGNHLAKFGFKVTALTVTFDTQTGTARVFGVAADQETKEKVILAAGNVEGVAAVDDMMTVERSAPAAQYYTVTPSSRATPCRRSPSSSTAMPTITCASSRPTSRC